jgi:glycosyltransferase involved in cell wall biosynthesis
MEYPLVSAIVLSYNQARFVTECLEAVKAQHYPNLEVIINDDASRDDSVAVIEKWLQRCNIPHRFLRSKTNLGICRSLNNALAVAQGKYISGIAADDAWLPNKLQHQVALMERAPEKVGVVYSDALLMDEESNLLPQTFLQTSGRTSGFSTMPQGDIHRELWQSNFVGPLTTLVRHECYRRVGLFDEKLFSEDWDMWLRISRCYHFIYSPEASAKYRLVKTSASSGQFPRLVDDMCQTCLKHLKSGQLPPDAWQEATRKLNNVASSSFNQRSPRHKYNLLQALRYRPTAGIMARLLLSYCGLGGEDFERLRSLCGRGAPHSGVISEGRGA